MSLSRLSSWEGSSWKAGLWSSWIHTPYGSSCVFHELSRIDLNILKSMISTSWSVFVGHIQPRAQATSSNHTRRGIGVSCSFAEADARHRPRRIFPRSIKNMSTTEQFAVNRLHNNRPRKDHHDRTQSRRPRRSARKPLQHPFQGSNPHPPFDHAAAEAWKERSHAFEREQYAKNPKLRAEAVARATKSRNRRKAAQKTTTPETEYVP
jgi:hypothetical protein